LEARTRKELTYWLITTNLDATLTPAQVFQFEQNIVANGLPLQSEDIESSAVDAASIAKGTRQTHGGRLKQLSDLVNCHAGISPEMAIRLDEAFGGGAETWHRMQASYDMAQALKNAMVRRVSHLEARDRC
jgi:addiction module HigA family antidote